MNTSTKRTTTKAEAMNAVSQHEAAALTALAEDIAQEMNEEHFSSRFGFGSIEPHRGRLAGFYFYDNNPLSNDPVRPLDAEGTRRATDHAEIIVLRATRGCALAAQASYPTTGDDRGYTGVLIFMSASGQAAKQDLQAARDRWPDVVTRRFTGDSVRSQRPS